MGVGTEIYVTPWFSSSTTWGTFCPEGSYAYGLQCKDHNCAKMKIFCKIVGEQIALINLWQSSVDLTFNDCGGEDLATHYETVHPGKSISNYITGDCEAPLASFLASKAKVVNDPVNWVKVAGRGVYGEPNNSMHVEQFQTQGTTLTSYSRAEFEALWTNSNQVLLRRCKNCIQTHRYVYLKRHDTNGLPPNVDLLNDVKGNWKSYENNTAHQDFDLYSTYDDAIFNKNPWQHVNMDYHNIGFARSSGPYKYVNHQWNVWEQLLRGHQYGQPHIAFYVAMPAGESPV